jgi:AraC-like DNA-binding protein/pimeloyl-ACP methyl ester carboxylesterase
MTDAFESWRREGRTFRHIGHEIFYRDAGSGPTLLAIHGFPSASWDWHPLWADLTARFRVIAADMIGYGWSAKPRGYAYSFFDQATLHEELLAGLGIERVHLLAHDYGDTVAQELLARFAERTQRESPGLILESACMLNGGIFPKANRSPTIQKLLAGPLGPLLARLIRKGARNRRFSPLPPTRSARKLRRLAALDGRLDSRRNLSWVTMIDSAERLSVTGKIMQRQTFDDCALIATNHQPGTRITSHRHDNAFFVAVIQGAYYQTCAGTKALCDVQSVRYLAPGEVHSSEFGEGSLCLNLEIFPHHFKGIERALRNSASGEVRHTTARDICGALWDAMAVRDNLVEFSTLTAMLDLTALLGGVREGRAISPPLWLKRTREYLNAFCACSLSLDDLSQTIEHHPTHISREFRRYYGKTLVQFVRERRVLRAREMLLSTKDPIVDISSRCGFYDQSHLTNAFRKQLGYTPAQCRTNRLSNRYDQI